jgi:simple sugar transport system permease protein
VAWLARLNPLAIILAGYLFGGLLVGGDVIQPAGIPLLIQGIILFCVISADTLARYRLRLGQAKPATTAASEEAAM